MGRVYLTFRLFEIFTYNLFIPLLGLLQKLRNSLFLSIQSETENIYQTGELILNDDTKKVIVDGKEVKLTGTEFNILKFLLKNKGKVYSITQIYENVWNDEAYAAENIIAVHIRHIREKIEINPKNPKYLKVVWGVGYKIEKQS